jgi:WD40 repeat protein
VTAGGDGQVYLWDRNTDTRIKPIIAQNEPISATEFTPDGKHLIVVGFRCKLLTYDLQQRELIDSWQSPCMDMRAVAASADQQWIAAGGRNGIVRIWSRDSRQVARDIRAQNQRIRTIAFDKQSKRLITAGEDRTIHVFDIASGQAIGRIAVQTSKVMSLAVLDADHVAAAGSDNIIRAYDLESGQISAELAGHTGSVATLTRNANLLASGSYDTTIRVWNIAELSGQAEQTARSTDTQGGVQ